MALERNSRMDELAMNTENPVLTAAQARKILKGRLPHMPVQYEQALQALQECIDLDEAKIWDNKADMLAAWAKMFHHPEAERKAHALKLHAYRRMDQLSRELRPNPEVRKGQYRYQPGPRSLLREAGLTRAQAGAAATLGKMTTEKFDELVNLPRPPSPMTADRQSRPFNKSEAWRKLVWSGASLSGFRGFCRANPAKELARALTSEEGHSARIYITDIQEWLDEFEQYLPKVIEGKP